MMTVKSKMGKNQTHSFLGVSITTALDHQTGLQDWTTRLTQTAVKFLVQGRREVNEIIHSVTLGKEISSLLFLKIITAYKYI